MRLRKTGTSTWTTSTVSGTSANATGLAAAISYEFQVGSTCSGGSSAYSSSKSFTTAAATVSYCASKGSNSSYEWIDLVEFDSFKNVTGNDGGYKDFTSLTANVARGGSSTIYISAGFSGTAYSEFWEVWIDFNQDGDFEDSGELVVSGSSTSSANLSAAVNIPSTALLGKTRMRVSMKYDAAQTSCETFSYGEVEDYSVNITNTLQSIVSTQSLESSSLGNEVVENVIVYPNPASSSIRVVTRAKEAKVKVMSLRGAALLHVELKEGRNQRDISTLPAGTYLLEVHDGQILYHQRIVKQ